MATTQTPTIADGQPLAGWHHGPMYGFDLETTGPDPLTARIVTAAIVKLGNGAPEHLNWLSDVDGQEIPEEAAKIHGVTTEKASAEGMPLRDVAAQVVAQLRSAVANGIPIVAMNARYDLTVLDRELRRFDLPAFPDQGGPALLVVDPYVIDKHVDRYRKGKRNLTALCAHYQVKLDGAHNAQEDTLGACRVAWRIANTRPKIAAMTLAQLHEAQKGWALEQAAGLQEHFRKTDPDAVVEGRWPVIPLEDEAPAAGEQQQAPAGGAPDPDTPPF